MTTLDGAVALAATENGLAVISTVRADQTVQASLVNVGRLAHPANGQLVLGFTTDGKVKLANLRPGRSWPSPSATAGSGRPSRAAPSWSARTTPSRG